MPSSRWPSTRFQQATTSRIVAVAGSLALYRLAGLI